MLLRTEKKLRSTRDTEFLHTSAPSLRKNKNILYYLVRLVINVGAGEDLDYEIDGLEFANRAENIL